MDLLRAISHGETILSWHENLPADEVPEEWMWALPEELEEWFEQVKIAREERYNPQPVDAEEGPMLRNELTQGLR